MDGKVKLNPEMIEILQKSNSNYPSCTEDYDIRFLFHLLKAVFTKEELANCYQASSIQYLDRVKLKFVKGVQKIYFMLILERILKCCYF